MVTGEQIQRLEKRDVQSSEKAHNNRLANRCPARPSTVMSDAPPAGSVVHGVRFSLERVFDAPPAQVFDALVDPDLAPRWMWAGVGTNPNAELDLRVGGRYRIAIDPADGEEGWKGGADLAMSGIYVEIIRDRRLVFTLHWEADVGYNRDGEVLDEAVIIDLDEVERGTRLVLQHVGIPNDGVSAAEHCRGTAAALDQLAILLQG
ncbi:MAG TPA: SRPBCC domain-containing protein [Acidimicrobiia bacterium]|jgi:uncharacterized protein YndB with AHSA1/START domain|nr:SRPBCC domain-containing protein [Acidimicrobiia bacterium]